jgi:hypothetical protein
MCLRLRRTINTVGFSSALALASKANAPNLNSNSNSNSNSNCRTLDVHEDAPLFFWLIDEIITDLCAPPRLVSRQHVHQRSIQHTPAASSPAHIARRRLP